MPTLRRRPNGRTEAVFESVEVGIALNTIPRLVLEIPYDRTCPYRGTHFSVFSISAFGRRYVNGRTAIRKSAFLVTDMFFLLGPLTPTWRLCLVVFPGPRIQKRASCGNFSSFNLGCERKSEKCILSYGHVLSIGTSHTNLVMMFGGIPGSSDLKTALLRPV